MVITAFISGLVLGAFVISAMHVASDSDDRQASNMTQDDVAALVDKVYSDGYAAGKNDRG